MKSLILHHFISRLNLSSQKLTSAELRFDANHKVGPTLDELVQTNPLLQYMREKALKKVAEAKAGRDRKAGRPGGGGGGGGAKGSNFNIVVTKLLSKNKSPGTKASASEALREKENKLKKTKV